MFCLPLLPSPLPYMSKALRSTSSASSSCFCRSSLRSWSGFLGLRTYRKPWGSTRFREKALDRFREAFERRMVTTRISSASLPGRVTRMASPTEISFSNFVSCPDTTVPDVVMRPVPFWIVGANDDDASFVRFLGAERTSVSALVPGCFDALGGGGGDDDERGGFESVSPPSPRTVLDFLLFFLGRLSPLNKSFPFFAHCLGLVLVCLGGQWSIDAASFSLLVP
mmetsp:Transcript_6178/g.14466  ORF Transcript_6178/g.14466 Transcript_6178/m.14466 type:complete len:224 (+) Transcript_6178:3264-3935(+)